MPNLNGTGPQGQGSMSGRGRGRCRNIKTTQVEKPESQNMETKNVIYGLGRGGRPRGAGELGNRSGGGSGKGQNRG